VTGTEAPVDHGLEGRMRSVSSDEREEDAAITPAPVEYSFRYFSQVAVDFQARRTVTLLRGLIRRFRWLGGRVGH